MPTTRLVFFNPASGSAWIAQRTMRAIEQLVRIPGTQVVATERGSVAGQVHDHLTPAVRRVYAIGGDGTVGDVTTALVESDVALGIIPCGTTNVLAREFGISMWTKRAVEQLEASERTVGLRTWRVGEHTAVLGCGVGWDGRVMWRSPQALKQRLGRTAVALIGLREIANYEFPPLVLTGVDEHGATITIRGTSVILATVKRWAGGNTGIPQADPTDDFIDAVVLQSKSRFHLLTFWSLMTTPGGRPLMLPGVRTARLRSARVECEDGRAIEAHVNGEGVAKTPFTLEPGGIVRVLVP
ncbi:MAG: diacylglycerol kinase family protein [Gemmatimonadota bacterium]|nr:diacylglycerol kinase family protein [Gemmatimonadota bacterium]